MTYQIVIVSYRGQNVVNERSPSIEARDLQSVLLCREAED